MIDRTQITGTTNAWGGGTFTSPVPVVGEILEVRCPSTYWDSAGGTTDYTLTRLGDGGTILKLTNQSGPWQYQPRGTAHTLAGGTVGYAAGFGPVLVDNGAPVVDYLQLAVVQGGTAVAGTVVVHFRR